MCTLELTRSRGRCWGERKKEFPDAKNYLEQRCYDRETHKGYVMNFQRAEGNTPHEMRQKAEDKL